MASIYYSIHFIETTNKFKNNYNNVENPKKREVNMSNKKVQTQTQTETSQTKNRLLNLANH